MDCPTENQAHIFAINWQTPNGPSVIIEYRTDANIVDSYRIIETSGRENGTGERLPDLNQQLLESHISPIEPAELYMAMAYQETPQSVNHDDDPTLPTVPIQPIQQS
jgi:hypothetical protein